MSTRPQPSEQLIFDDPLSQQSAQSAQLWGQSGDGGWGEQSTDGEDGSAADLTRFLDEKPPHHI
ncbi:hypothetical protein LHJ74_24855 [Streptomyces sp. N2-109]|uniref:Uncharacterized protein n=1 Tax=Streptomyces gossypii TaxID=2883101 RepID=A0ABT2JZ34_9ACTN|nr:hypothetical protein [Streptomyces gossypii]MCT2593101.1 hypothetical protein [Streptomyces gossypii]